MRYCLPAGWKVLGIALVAGFACSNVYADEELFPLTLRNRVIDLRDGKYAIRDNKSAEHLKDIQQAARESVARLSDPKTIGQTGTAGTPYVTLVEEANRLIPNMPILEPAHNQAQKENYDRRKDFIQEYGQAIAGPLQEVLGNSSKFQGDGAGYWNVRIRLNAARILAQLGKSGYVKTDDKGLDTVDIALEVLENPKESDAVRVFALQALRNLLARPNPAGWEKTLLAKQPEREKKIILALIQFITREVKLPADASAEEFDAWRYVRREAIRALGQCRYMIVRDDKEKVVAEPGYWLLRIAAGDPVLNPGASLPERADALTGFLQLNPDPALEMDYASWFVAVAIRDLAAEFSARRVKVGGAPAPNDSEQVFSRDYMPWKTIWFKLDALFEPWKKAWEGCIANPPQGPLDMVNDLYAQCDGLIFKLTAKVTTLPNNVEYETITSWLQNQGPKVTAKSLFKDDPNSVIQLQRN
jgi:hypothetical protein